MEKFIIDECTGWEYELKGDYYYPTGRVRKNGIMVPEEMPTDDQAEEKKQPIGIWGERHLQYIKQYKKTLYRASPNLPAALLEKVSGYPFYNTSDFTLARLLNDSDNIASNFESYIEGFSANVQTILANLDFKKQIEKMDKNNRLYGVVKKFSDINFDPSTVDGMRMGYIFEDIIRRFSENAEAGDHYTPREVIRLLVNVLLAEGCDDLLTDEGRIATVLDIKTPRLIQFNYSSADFAA